LNRFQEKIFICLLLLISIFNLGCIPVGTYSDSKLDKYDTTSPSQNFIWDFSNQNDYVLSDENTIKYNNGVTLKALDQNHDSALEFAGTHDGTSYSSSQLSILPKTDSSHDVTEILSVKNSNLIGYWKLDNDATDSSGNSRNGTLVNNSNFSTTSKLGSHSIELDGTGDYVDLDAHAAAIPTGVDNFTVAMWVKFDVVPGQPEVLLAYGGNENDDGFEMRLHQTSKFSFIVWDVDGGANGSANFAEDPIVGTWYHLVGVYDHVNVSLYLNGELVAQDPSTGNMNPETTLRLGGEFNRSYDLDGNLDEVAIWDTDLSAAEITSLYQGQARHFSSFSSAWTPKWDSMVAYWKMDGNWQDSVATNHLTVGNDTVFSSTSRVGNSSAEFDGTGDFLSAPHSASLNPGAELAISTWVKLNEIDPNTNFGDMIYIKGNWNLDNSSTLTLYSNALRCNLGRPWSQGPSYPASNLKAETWYHIVCTADALGHRLYVNGELVASNALAPTTVSDTSTMYIGSWNGGVGPVNGLIDDFAMWSESLSTEEVSLIYHRQKQAFSGMYASKIIDTTYASSSWDASSWITDLPFNKELPGTEGFETSESYSSKYVSTTLDTDLIGLWHLNEATATTGVANDFVDSSGNGNDGELSGGVTFAEQGVLSNSAGFDGISGVVELPASSSLNIIGDITVSSWFKISDLTVSNNIVHKGAHYSVLYHGSGGMSWADSSSWNYAAFGYHGTVQTGKWNHVLVSKSGSIVTMYLNGEVIISQAFGGPLTTDTSVAHLGCYAGNTMGSACSSGWLNGNIDEVAIWNRALNSTEALEMYRRGVNRVKLQVKSCDDSVCAGEEWFGPDGTASTWFSELNNCDTLIGATGVCDFSSGAMVNTSAPSVRFSDFTNLSVPNNQYFQYRVLVESDDESSTPTYPSLSSVNVGPAHYFTTSPTVHTMTGPTFKVWRGFDAEVSGGCTPKFNASIDRDNWYYFANGLWNLSSSVAEANTLVEMNENALSFHQDIESGGTLYIRAILESPTGESCSVTSMKASYQYELPEKE
jgi:hypothetical protein